MRYLVYVLSISIAIMLLTGCSNEKKTLFEKANEDMRTKLKVPGSAKFHDYGESKVSITDSAGTANPWDDNTSEQTKRELDSSYRKNDDTYYSVAKVENSFECQNSYGVFMASRYVALYRKWHYKNAEPGDWTLLTFAIE